MLSRSHHALHAPNFPVIRVLWCSHPCSESSASSEFSSSLVLSHSHHALHAPSSPVLRFSGALTPSPCSACSRFSSALCSLVLSLSHHALSPLQAPSSPVLWVLWCSHSLIMLYKLQVLQYSGFSGALTPS